MKNNISKIKLRGLGQIETPETNPLIAHFLSPLERAAYRYKFKPFNYDFDGLIIEIEQGMCHELFKQARSNTNTMRDILQPARIKLLKRSDEQIKRFLFKPLKHHLLPARIYHILAGNYCHTMEDVARKGEYGLKRMRGIGKANLAFIINLFIENGCGSLFI